MNRYSTRFPILQESFTSTPYSNHDKKIRNRNSLFVADHRSNALVCFCVPNPSGGLGLPRFLPGAKANFAPGKGDLPSSGVCETTAEGRRRRAFRRSIVRVDRGNQHQGAASDKMTIGAIPAPEMTAFDPSALPSPPRPLPPRSTGILQTLLVKPTGPSRTLSNEGRPFTLCTHRLKSSFCVHTPIVQDSKLGDRAAGTRDTLFLHSHSKRYSLCLGHKRWGFFHEYRMYIVSPVEFPLRPPPPARP